MKTPSYSKTLGVLTCAFFLGLLQSTLVLAYSDTEDYVFTNAADYLTEEGIISGYSDGTLKPDNSINRAEFLKIVVLASGATPEGSDCFTDVSDQWFAPYVCFAQEEEMVNGYEDASFKPENTITLVEALKIVTKVLDLPMEEPEGDEWYSEYLETLASQNAIPYTLDYYDELLTRGEAFELLWRLLTDQSNEPATTLEEFKGPSCEDFEAETFEGIDLDRVQETWIDWTNDARAANGLPTYTSNTQLDRTAYIWSAFGRDRGYMSHTRPGTTAYYDYYAIQDWFEDSGVTFQSVGGYTFTENIGRGPYSCSAEDCTDELINAIEYTFDYFMSEAGSSYAPHYNSIMNTSFKQIGFGIVVTDSSYYMTIHYGTIVESSVAPYCD